MPVLPILFALAIAFTGPATSHDDGAPPLESSMIRIDQHLWTGRAPEQAGELDALAELGVRTLISVDAARPNLKTAGMLGMRYVHIPLGYGRIDPLDAVRLARAVRDLPGPIYLHCHHGRHRGPVAAVVAQAALGRLATDQGKLILEQAGTSRDYPGLIQSAAQATRLDTKLIDAVRDVDLPHAATVKPMASGMAELDRAFLALKRAQTAPHAATLTDHFRSLADIRSSSAMRRGLLRSAAWSTQLETAIEQDDELETRRLMDLIATACRDCHQNRRDRISLPKKVRGDQETRARAPDPKNP